MIESQLIWTAVGLPPHVACCGGCGRIEPYQEQQGEKKGEGENKIGENR